MIDLKEKIIELLKNPKMLMMVGIFGMVIILVSSFFDGKAQKPQQSEPYTAEQYKHELEESVTQIVSHITGDRKPTVVITLESGIRYSYADEAQTDTESSSGTQNAESRESKKQSYITVKNSDGGESALLVTEIMPEIRGVAIVCDGVDSEIAIERVKNAVTAALNITSKRVYISGGAER